MKETNKKLTREECQFSDSIKERYYRLVLVSLIRHKQLEQSKWSSCELRNGEIEHAGFFSFLLAYFLFLAERKEKSDLYPPKMSSHTQWVFRILGCWVFRVVEGKFFQK
jgi:hypothetical protein